jgi:hypothetical protein
MQRKATSLPYTELEIADGNFDSSRAPIDRIVIHTMVGTWQGAAMRFDNPTEKVSAHYGVKLDGGLIHWLEEYYTAYHAGNYTMNQRSIGIEHEDGGDFNGVRPDILYASTAKLVADICTFYNIPIDRQHIIKHSEVIATGCPDALDIDRIVREANKLASGGTTAPSTDALAACLEQHTALVNLNNSKDQTIAQLSKGNDDKQKQLDELNQKVHDLEGQVSTLGTDNLNLKVNISQVQKDNSDLLGKMQEMAKSDSTAIDLGIASEQKYKDLLAKQAQKKKELATILDKWWNIVINAFISKKKV